MKSSFADLLPELLELLVVAGGSLGLAVAGTSIERFALGLLQHGDVSLALWAAFVGVGVLWLAYTAATDAVPPRVAAVRQQIGDGSA